jgi:hypothetical protein
MILKARKPSAGTITFAPARNRIVELAKTIPALAAESFSGWGTASGFENTKVKALTASQCAYILP